MKETRMQHWRRRGAALRKHTKGALCALYRDMGGLGGVHPPEKWRKDELITSIVEMEWSRLPEEQKLPDPPLYDPPCDTCGKGPEAHPYGHDHHYAYTAGAAPEDRWVCRTCGMIRVTHVGDRCLTAEDLEAATAVRAIFSGDMPAPTEDQDQSDGPPCGRCGHSPAEHLGWNRGHLWIRSMHYQQPAEVQPPQGAEATATPECCPPGTDLHTPAPRTFEVVMSSSGHIDDPYLPCRGPQCDGECNISERDCPGYRPGFPLDHHTATVYVPCMGDDCTGCSDSSGGDA